MMYLHALEPRLFLNPNSKRKIGFPHKIILKWKRNHQSSSTDYKLEKELAPSNASFKLLVFCGMSTNYLCSQFPWASNTFWMSKQGYYALSLWPQSWHLNITQGEKPNVVHIICWLMVISSNCSIFQQGYIATVAFVFPMYFRCNSSNFFFKIFLKDNVVHDLLLLLWAYKWKSEMEVHLRN